MRRVIKKFHAYTSLSHTPVVPAVVSLGSTTETSVEDAREAFLVELATFQLSLKKSAMICEAEARQVEEYQRERQRIGMVASLTPFLMTIFYLQMMNMEHYVARLNS